MRETLVADGVKEEQAHLFQSFIIRLGKCEIKIPPQILDEMGASLGDLLEIAIRLAPPEVLEQYYYLDAPKRSPESKPKVNCPACGCLGTPMICVQKQEHVTARGITKTCYSWNVSVYHLGGTYHYIRAKDARRLGWITEAP